jgi:hypothetical protein
MLKARTSSLVRVFNDGRGCTEAFDRETRSLTPAPFLELVDLRYSTPSGGEYDACAGGDRDVHGVCCSGALVGPAGALECDNRGENQLGHFMKHVISLVERAHYDVGGCTSELQEFTESYPYWVFYSPGEGGKIAVPDLPVEFAYACGGVGTAACPPNTRMGLPTRLGSGADCSQCESGEDCVSLDGGATEVCAARGPNDELIVRDYEWRAELYNLDLVGDSCQASTPCKADDLPVSDDGSFSGQFAFGETTNCVVSQSTNVLIVN